MRSSTDFWNRRISRRATMPGRKRCGILTPPMAAALLRRTIDRDCRDFPQAVAPAIRLMAWLLVRALHKNSSSFSKHRTLTHTYIRWKKMTCQLAIEFRSGSRSKFDPDRDLEQLAPVLVQFEFSILLIYLKHLAI